MKQTTKIALSAICAAIATALMLLSYFPYLTYAVPAVAGLFIAIPLIEINPKYALGAYIVSALLTLIVAESEAKLLYVCLFGFYPIIKALVERIRKIPIEWVIKLVVFNAAALIDYYGSTLLLGISFDDLGIIGKYGIYIFWAAANVIFVLYDIAISRVSMLYMFRIHPKIKKILK